MTREKAKEIIFHQWQSFLEDNIDYAGISEAYKMAISALSENKGEWKRISPAGIYECSCCGQNVMTSDIECYKFCHGCGAKMEAVSE